MQSFLEYVTQDRINKERERGILDNPSKSSSFPPQQTVEKANAYWISPQGIIEAVDNIHIKRIIDNPEKFGYSKEYIQRMYDQSNEKVGDEGEARERIILQLVEDGWIRIRYYKNLYWSVNVKELNKRTQSILEYWANKMVNLLNHYGDDVNIDSQAGHKKYHLMHVAEGIWQEAPDYSQPMHITW